jgi:hypothetical protein
VSTIVQRIAQDYSEYATARDNALLFSHETELEDLKRSSADTEMRVIPFTREDFKWLTNARFISFLRASFGIKRSQEGFLRVSKNQSPEDL